jgi:hypothetical protein
LGTPTRLMPLNYFHYPFLTLRLRDHEHDYHNLDSYNMELEKGYTTRAPTTSFVHDERMYWLKGDTIEASNP